MNWLLNLFSGGLGATAQGVARGVATFTGDQVQREASVHDEQIAVMGQQASEFQYRGNRNWFDSLIDGINRLPRPVIAFGTIGLFVWCIVDPAEFTIAMLALGVMPEWLAIVIGQVVLLYMGGRMLNDWKMGKSATADQVRSVLALQNEVRGLRAASPMPDRQFEASMADTSNPLGRPAIDEWNRRRKAESGLYASR
mgnify:CR=1 FL=1